MQTEFVVPHREQVFIGKQKEDMDGTAVPTPYIHTVMSLLITTTTYFCSRLKLKCDELMPPSYPSKVKQDLFNLIMTVTNE